MKKNDNIEVLISGQHTGFQQVWERVTDAKQVDNGFLNYEMKDGTIGLARPGRWRWIEDHEDVRFASYRP